MKVSRSEDRAYIPTVIELSSRDEEEAFKEMVCFMIDELRENGLSGKEDIAKLVFELSKTSLFMDDIIGRAGGETMS